SRSQATNDAVAMIGPTQKVRLKPDPTDEGSAFTRTTWYSGTSQAAATSINTVVLDCRPKRGSSTNPATRLPPTAPAVLARYSTPARRPTDCSACWMTAFARGKLKPINNAGTATSSSIGRMLNPRSLHAPGA